MVADEFSEDCVVCLEREWRPWALCVYFVQEGEKPAQFGGPRRLLFCGLLFPDRLVDWPWPPERLSDRFLASLQPQEAFCLVEPASCSARPCFASGVFSDEDVEPFDVVHLEKVFCVDLSWCLFFPFYDSEHGSEPVWLLWGFLFFCVCSFEVCGIFCDGLS